MQSTSKLRTTVNVAAPTAVLARVEVNDFLSLQLDKVFCQNDLLKLTSRTFS